jgi:hypothetical protein
MPEEKLVNQICRLPITFDECLYLERPNRYRDANKRLTNILTHQSYDDVVIREHFFGLTMWIKSEQHEAIFALRNWKGLRGLIASKPKRIKLFKSLFRGSSKLHYKMREALADDRGIESDGLVEMDTVYQEISDDDYETHLDGLNPSLLAVPFCDGVSSFGAINLYDCHPPINQTALARKISGLGLPLVLTAARSTTTLWLFIEGEPLPHTEVRELLKEYAEKLGISQEFDIFPDGVNGAELPYFGNKHELALDEFGMEIDIEQFFDLARYRMLWADGAPNKERPLAAAVVRNIFERVLVELRSTKPDARCEILHFAFLFAARAFAAGVFKSKEEAIEEIGEAAHSFIKPCGGLEKIEVSEDELQAAARGWEEGAANPLNIFDETRHIEGSIALANRLTREFPPLEEFAHYLACLSPAQYEELRVGLADRFKVRPGALDSIVRAARKERDEAKRQQEIDDTPGTEIEIENTEPWGASVNLPTLLNELSTLFRRYIVFQNASDADMLALWVVVTYAKKFFNIAPMVGVTAPSPNCGKTSLMRILGRLASRALLTISVTPASLFRVVDMLDPTLLVDELDKLIQDKNSEILSILLAGHERELAKVFKCAGDATDIKLRAFNCFGPKCWAQIGLPDSQLTSRSIVVKLLRKKPNETVEAWPRVGMPLELDALFKRLRQQCQRWINDNSEAIENSKADVSGLDNRLADNWYPLIVVANLAGSEWRERARLASGVAPIIEEESEAITLLRDIRNIFHSRGVDKIPSKILLADLLLLSESPWKCYERQRDGLSANQLADKLGKMGIKSRDIRFTEFFPEDRKKAVCKGYRLDAFVNLFERQLGDAAVEEVEIEKRTF